ncbi:hypothetical protein GCM10011335_07670 [Aureimonas glaciei]|uniref:Uncharacterized protein n=1 Tax=Aureimonas glaciei TaxID=1776957 RepID=A0A917D8I2_9HYPH|nr:hypothetical protein GCM10011335_07670 [Aureimonas glaciei]
MPCPSSFDRLRMRDREDGCAIFKGGTPEHYEANMQAIRDSVRDGAAQAA